MHTRRTQAHRRHLFDGHPKLYHLSWSINICNRPLLPTDQDCQSMIWRSFHGPHCVIYSQGDPGAWAAKVLQQINEGVSGEGARSWGYRLPAETAPHPLRYQVHQEVRGLFTHHDPFNHHHHRHSDTMINLSIICLYNLSSISHWSISFSFSQIFMKLYIDVFDKSCIVMFYERIFVIQRVLTMQKNTRSFITLKSVLLLTHEQFYQ